MAVDVVIYHNPACGTSRNTLAMIRNAGIEPHVVEYLKTPPARALLVELIDRAGITPRDLLREKGTPYAELGLGDTSLTDDALLDALPATVDPCGENGEFHSCVWDGPMFTRPVPIQVHATVVRDGFAFADLRLSGS